LQEWLNNVYYNEVFSEGLAVIAHSDGYIKWLTNGWSWRNPNRRYPGSLV
jgi:hypothetical protein